MRIQNFMVSASDNDKNCELPRTSDFDIIFFLFLYWFLIQVCFSLLDVVFKLFL